MSRIPKDKSITDEQMIKLFDGWLAENGYTNKINYSSLERYAKEHGVAVTRTTFTRRKALQLHIQETFSNMEEAGLCGDGYRMLDINKILETFTKKHISKVLHDLDNQNKLKSNAINILQNDNEKKNREIKALKEELDATKEKLVKKTKRVEELISAEKELAEIKRLYKKQEQQLVAGFYSRNNDDKKKTDKVLYINEETSIKDVEREDRKSRIQIIKQELKGEQ